MRQNLGKNKFQIEFFILLVFGLSFLFLKIGLTESETIKLNQWKTKRKLLFKAN